MVHLVAAVVLLVAPLQSPADEDMEQKLKELESQIAKAPEDPMLFYRKAQCLMKLGKFEDGYQTAKRAKALFVKKGNKLPWIMLEQIDLGHVRVDVHLNMGARERRPPETGIIRPLSFRIWSSKDEPQLLATIDFEIGLSNGKPSTAALGQMIGRGHANFGMLDTDATYAKIRERVISLVKKRYADQ